MTVAEFIELLYQMPQDASVVILVADDQQSGILDISALESAELQGGGEKAVVLHPVNDQHNYQFSLN